KQGQCVTHAQTRRHHWPSPTTGTAGRTGAAHPVRAVATVSPSMHVAPVFLLEQPGEEREEGQEQHDPDAEGLALEHGWLAGVLEESGDVAHGLVELLGRLGARLREDQLLDRALAAGVRRTELGVLQALHLPQG